MLTFLDWCWEIYSCGIWKSVYSVCISVFKLLLCRCFGEDGAWWLRIRAWSKTAWLLITALLLSVWPWWGYLIYASVFLCIKNNNASICLIASLWELKKLLWLYHIPQCFSQSRHSVSPDHLLYYVIIIMDSLSFPWDRSHISFNH